MSHDADQIHPASPLRLQQSRRDGKVAKSHELANAIHLLIATGASWLLLPMVGLQFREMAKTLWSSKKDLGNYQASHLYQDLGIVLLSVGIAILPLLVLLMLAGFLSHVIQTGPMFVSKRIVPDFQQMSPANWFARVFSITNFARAVLSLPKFVFAISTAGFCLWCQQTQVYEMVSRPFAEMVNGLCLYAIQVSFCVAMVLLLLSMSDYVLEWFTHQSQLKMTDQQLRDEQRMDNIDPAIRNRRKLLYRSFVTR